MPEFRQRLALGLILATCVAGCVETGDFGRVKRHSAWNDAVAATGSILADRRGEAVSSLPLTDDEREFRDRAWRFLVPGHDRPWFDRALADLVATRLLPSDAADPDERSYVEGLLSDGAVSPASRYRRLSEDAAADARLLPGIATVAARVQTADGVRLKTVAHAGGFTPPEIADAEARVVENRCLLAWVRIGLDSRLAAYRYALTRLVVAAPQADAVPAERSLALLADSRGALAGFGAQSVAAACAGGRAPGPAIAGAPLVRKG